MNPPRIGSLFSGYGGLDLAVTSLFPDSHVAWHCEYDDAPARILAHHYPDVPNYRDVTTIDWATMPPIDILTGGYPCQPFSAAGRRKGTDDERHLWPYVREAIRHLRPRYTFLENVAGHRTLGFDRVLGDMAEDGLHVRWCSLRASDVGAPHHRERLFILVTPADADDLVQCPQPGGLGEGSSRRERSAQGEDRRSRGSREDAPDTDSGERYRDERTQGRGALGRETTTGDRPGLSPDATGIGRDRGPFQLGGTSVHPSGDRALPSNPDRKRLEELRQSESLGSEFARGLGGVGALPDAEGQRRGAGRLPIGTGTPITIPDSDSGIDWGTYKPAIERWERLTRPAPAPTELNSNGRPRLNAAFAEWMMGLSAGWVTDPAIGITRSEQLKAIGNGVVPQQAATAYAHLLSLDVIQIQYEVIP